MPHVYTFDEMLEMDLDEIRLVALMVGVQFNFETKHEDLLVKVLKIQHPEWTTPPNE